MMRFVFSVVFLLVLVTIVLAAPPIVLKEVRTSTHITVHVGYNVNGAFRTLYSSCISLNRLEVFYVEHELDPASRENCLRITFRKDSFSPSVNLEALYKIDNQKKVAVLDKYVNSKNYLARGHLAAMGDYGAAIDQLCTFYYINIAPQWQSFNNANWKSLEYRVRQRFIKPHYDTVIYTGTIGVLRLPDKNNVQKNVYLDKEKKINVPLFFYKVVYDNGSGNGTAFVGINNPFFKDASAAASVARTLCTDRCRNNQAFDWLKWKPDIVTKGYSFCCTVDDLRRKVPRLPAFRTNSLLV